MRRLLPFLALLLPSLAAQAGSVPDDPQWQAALAEVHLARKAAHEVATMKIYMPTVQHSVHEPRLNAIRERLLKPPAAAIPLTPGAASRRWHCLERYRFQVLGHAAALETTSIQPSEGVREGLAREELDPPFPGCAGVLREGGDDAALVLTAVLHHVGHRHAANSPCLFQAKAVEVEKGGTRPGDEVEFDHGCEAASGGKGALLRLRLDGEGKVLTVEPLESPTGN